MEIPVTTTLIVAGAIASRDYMPVHHDRDFANSQGSKDIFLNILTTNGLCVRFLHDWAGPEAMVKKLSAKNAEVKDLGVKQAPFVVLIGAGMPSVLAEISFVTNRQEGALLKTPAYRQQIAESLLDAILTYQRSLKGVRAVASKE